MSKNILIISASPRKNGNSDLLCNSFMDGAKEAGNNVEKIFLKDENINYCTGCGYCVSNRKKCSQKDDMVKLFDKMLNADTIVMATPIYFYTMNGQLKTFIDRLCAIYQELSGKDFYFMMTMADGNEKLMDRAISEFRGLTTCISNPVEKGILRATGVWNVGDIKKTNFLNEAFEMGKNV